MRRRITQLVALADRIADWAEEGFSAAREAHHVAAVMSGVSQNMERCLPADELPDIACGPGCSACCVVNVSALIPEGIVIARHLCAVLEPEALRDLKGRMDRLSERVRWVDDAERPRLGLSCVFLDEGGRCIIHPVRPLLCRSVSSTDPAACSRFLSSDDPEPVVMNLPQKILCNLVLTTLAVRLQRLGLDCRSIELTRLVAHLLEHPLHAAQFVAGRRIAFP